MKLNARLAKKINSEQEDHLQNGDDLFLIGELIHKDIKEKLYLYILSSKDKAGVFIIDRKVEEEEDYVEMEINPSLYKYITAIKLRFKSNFLLYEICTED